MSELPKTEIGFIDTMKYVYDMIRKQVSIIEKVQDRVYVRTLESMKGTKRPFITLTDMGEGTNFMGIRGLDIQIDVFATSKEEARPVKEYIIDLFNRTNYKGVRSSLKRVYPSKSQQETGMHREIMLFEFVVKDQGF